mgnify:CR=1 FL=1
MSTNFRDFLINYIRREIDIDPRLYVTMPLCEQREYLERVLKRQMIKVNDFDRKNGLLSRIEVDELMLKAVRDVQLC